MTRYSMSDKAFWKRILKMLLLLLMGAAMVAANLYLGLPAWKKPQYKLVSVGLLAICVVCVSTLMFIGGSTRRKNGWLMKRLIAVGAFCVVSVLAWVAMTAADSHRDGALLIFLVSVVLSIVLVCKAFNIVKHLWNQMSSASDSKGNTIRYPGDYVLSEVSISDKLTAPMGNVLIRGNAVLFVLPVLFKGHAVVKPDGSLEIRRTAGINEDKSVESTFDYVDKTYESAQGAEHVMDIVREECAKRGIAEPPMIYDYAVFLPNFASNNYVYDELSYAAVSWSEKIGTYKNYLKRADRVQSLNSKACFSTGHLESMLSKMNAEYRRANPTVNGDGRVVAECIAEACELSQTQK